MTMLKMFTFLALFAGLHAHGRSRELEKIWRCDARADKKFDFMTKDCPKSADIAACFKVGLDEYEQQISLCSGIPVGGLRIPEKTCDPDGSYCNHSNNCCGYCHVTNVCVSPPPEHLLPGH